MIRARIALVALALALALAACAGSFGLRTEVTDDVAGQCDQSYGVYEGDRRHCEVERDKGPVCTPGAKKQSADLYAKGVQVCSRNPLETAANRAAIDDILAKQRKVGR